MSDAMNHFIFSPAPQVRTEIMQQKHRFFKKSRPACRILYSYVDTPNSIVYNLIVKNEIYPSLKAPKGDNNEYL